MQKTITLNSGTFVVYDDSLLLPARDAWVLVSFGVPSGCYGIVQNIPEFLSDDIKILGTIHSETRSAVIFAGQTGSKRKQFYVLNGIPCINKEDWFSQLSPEARSLAIWNLEND